MFKSMFILGAGTVFLLTGCADFALPKRTDGVSSSTGTVRTPRSTKHASNTPPNVLGTSGSKDKNESKSSGPAKTASAPAVAPGGDETEIRDVVAIVGGGASPRSYANEDVVSVNNAKVARQPVIDLDQLNSAPLAKRATPLIPDRPRLYAFGPTKPGSTLADIADHLLPSTRVTVAQMMWALYRKNPGAFVNKNINNLKPRSLLNVPELDELMAVSRTDAETQIARLGGSVKSKLNVAY